MAGTRRAAMPRPDRRPRIAGRITALLAALLLGPGAALAEPYRLVPGDRIEVSMLGEPERIVAAVDIDGQVRLPDIGAVPVATLTLDEAAAAIEVQTERLGQLLEARASVSISDYAAIVIAGDVARPGRQDYLPGMTVTTALGLAGGGAAGADGLGQERARVSVAGELQRLNLEIASLVARLGRLEAALADSATPDPAEWLMSAIPDPAAIPLADMLDVEARTHADRRAQRDALLAYWADEIATIEAQQALFRQRIELHAQVIANAEAALAAARELQDRGLQTAARMDGVEQRFIDAQSRSLELESALIAASRALADARRARTRYLGEARDDTLALIGAARMDLDRARLRHAEALQDLAVLTGAGAVSPALSDVIELDFALVSPRDGRPGGMEVTPDTTLLPGDTLIVEVIAHGSVLSGGPALPPSPPLSRVAAPTAAAVPDPPAPPEIAPRAAAGPLELYTGDRAPGLAPPPRPETFPPG
ncbi:hypothetical protein E2L08_07200 [Palleronia sediminis]|uniref:Polysaccharide export protein N-terminal domain-containing protein n=1 Tax=Palleronia sediminis TaxID=2547833 RepID=A0A4R6AHK4_9RHOB|nr:polysaccharide biosynthesis/export family protein [Palleronia sediminis]TDL81116.1 hypothetical protein E2L08_07200 [Palleronia sediminis]